ncbi:GGDEF domain-containing protein [Psychromonas marina]|uniref:GGDEF domain-containing protein n=1 Tax=Psychromonas marina TaxID=88364 RepID=A0ABQ6E107_9GAMM|nr:sensor domain-containing diguanylate cyclase [Psychromonas marina]GLS91026.1 GGDEF domain-containing protein [Psychromonas marina]
MKKPEIPNNEKQRLKTLKSLEVLDTKFEERFDRITRMAKRMFDVPIALVSLIDENRQWFKSCVGLTVRETAREISFCGHAIHGEEVFVITNALEDTRFADNPLVLDDPNIRFYAGCPLIINGHTLGTLCIIDSTPRPFDQNDIEALKDLALTVELELSAVQLATLDDLTGIANRRGFMALAQNSLNLSIRNNFPVTLVYLDLDGFKEINDNFGHAVGDSVLVDFANLLKNTFRGTDIIARLGGDEFVVSLSATSKQQAIKALEMFNITVFLYNQEHKHDYKLSFSSGIVEYDTKKHSSIEALLAAADKLMYTAKSGL